MLGWLARGGIGTYRALKINNKGNVAEKICISGVAGCRSRTYFKLMCCRIPTVLVQLQDCLWASFSFKKV